MICYKKSPFRKWLGLFVAGISGESVYFG